MKYPGLLMSVATLFFSMAVFAVELELIPGSFPAAQKPAFQKERAALLVEKKAIDRKVASHNRNCSTPKPHLVHKCEMDRLTLFKSVDSYQNKVRDFNKRVATIDKANTRPIVNPSAESANAESSGSKKP